MSSGQIDKVCRHVASNLEKLRSKRQMSMTELAKRAGLSRTMIRFVEQGVRNPTLATLLRLAHAFEIDVCEIIKKAQVEAKNKEK